MEPIEPPPRSRRRGWFAAGLVVGSILAAGVIALDRAPHPRPVKRPGPAPRSVVLWERPGYMWGNGGMTEDVTLTLPDGATMTIHQDGQTITVRDANNAELWSKNVPLENGRVGPLRNGVPIKIRISSIRSPVPRARDHRLLDSQDDKDYYGISFTNKEWGFINYKTSKYYSNGND